jgi:hypothetical protein
MQGKARRKISAQTFASIFLKRKRLRTYLQKQKGNDRNNNYITIIIIYHILRAELLDIPLSWFF